MHLLKSLGFAAICAAAVACGTNHAPVSTTQEAWNPANDPSKFAVRPAKFAALPLEGILPDAVYPWSDDYWATKRAGIAYRWQQHYPTPTGTYKDYRYQVLTRADFVAGANSTPALVDKLSPAEKYDLLQSRYEFPLVKQEFRNQLSAVSNGDVPGWFGICHGWAPATVMEREPGAKVVATNRDGIDVPFYTSDINALMSKVYADYLGATRFIGERCNTSSNEIRVDAQGRVIADACRDTNPATLHLVLASYLGKQNVAQRQGFVADVTRDAEVWNQGITGYKVVSNETTPFVAAQDPAARHRAPGTTQLVHVKTEMYYIGEIAPHRAPAASRRDEYTQTQELEYTLELDRNGTIIGGEWISEDRPDFIWSPLAAPAENATLSYRTIRDLLDRSRQ